MCDGLVLLVLFINISKNDFFGVLFFSESGCKDKDFQVLLPNVFGSFFSFIFQGTFLGKKERKTRAYQSDAVRMSNQMLCVSCKAGAKVELLTIKTKYIELFLEYYINNISKRLSIKGIEEQKNK